MGIENPEKIQEAIPFKKDFAELSEEEREVLSKVKMIFRKNAELNSLLLREGELDMTDHQKEYYGRQLRKFQEEARDVLLGLRRVTRYNVPEELKGNKAADKYYEDIRKAA